MLKKLGIIISLILALQLFVPILVHADGLDQWAAKKLGGKADIKLPPGEKLLLITFKHSNLWYLTEERDSSVAPKCYKFRESSTFGVFEGEITICEQ